METPPKEETVETAGWVPPASLALLVITVVIFKTWIGYHPCQRQAVPVDGEVVVAVVAPVVVKTVPL